MYSPPNDAEQMISELLLERIKNIINSVMSKQRTLKSVWNSPRERALIKGYITSHFNNVLQYELTHAIEKLSYMKNFWIVVAFRRLADSSYDDTAFEQELDTRLTEVSNIIITNSTNSEITPDQMAQYTQATKVKLINSINDLIDEVSHSIFNDFAHKKKRLAEKINKLKVDIYNSIINNESLEIINVLLDSAKVFALLNGFTVTDESGSFHVLPLNLAVEHNRSDLVTLFLQKEANPNLQDEQSGDTALHVAVSDANKHLIVQEILTQSQHQINFNIKNNEDKTALDCALDHGNAEIIPSMVNRHHKQTHPERNEEARDINHAFRIACAFGYENFVLIILKVGVDINEAPSRTQKTALHQAINRDQVRITTILLNQPDVRVDMPNHEGKTQKALLIKKLGGEWNIAKELCLCQRIISTQETVSADSDTAAEIGW